MLITVSAYTTLVATFRTGARVLSPRSACGRYSVLPEGLLGALPGHGQGIGRRLQGASIMIPEGRTSSNGPVVVGGAVLDCVIHIEDEHLKLDGRTVTATPGARAAGGVARNVAAALALLGAAPRLLTALGDDAAGRFVLASLPPAVDARSVLVQRGARTPVYAALLGPQGTVRLGLADMRLHARGLAAARLLPALRRLLAPDPSPAAAAHAHTPLVLVDGNAPADAITGLLQLCRELHVPVWFEPTDVHKAAKPFQTDLWKTISVASPNLNELRAMISKVDPGDQEYSELEPEMEAWYLSKKLLAQSPRLCLLVTLGPRGVLVVRHGGPEEPFFLPPDRIDSETEVSARLYPAFPPPPEANLNESGAGDCLAAGVICRALRGCSETQAIAAGLAAALASLVSPYAVPDKFPDHSIEKAHYRTIS